MISTRFLPISCTSPFTVASTILPRVDDLGLLHELFEIIDRGLHRLGRLQHLSHNQLVVVEQPPDFSHPRHQRAVDDIERARAFGALAVEIGNQTVLGAFDDVVRQALIERQLGGFFLFFLDGSCGNDR